MRAALALLALALAGCGRVGFDERDATRVQLLLADPGEELHDFPLPVLLDDARIARDRLRADASDLAFFSAEGAPLAAEIETLGVPGGAPLIAWVRVPQIGAHTTLTMQYGGAPAARDPDVWDDSFEAVWHLAGSGDAIDATSHHRDGTARGTDETAGMVGPARAFTAAHEDAIIASTFRDVDFPQITVTGWLRYTVPPPDEFYVVATRENGDSDHDDFFVGLHDVHSFANVTFVDSESPSAEGADVSANAWHHYGLTYDGTTLTAYVDGEISAAVVEAGQLATSHGPVYLGCDRDNEDSMAVVDQCDRVYLDGALDEIRIAHVTRSPAWMRYDVAAMQDHVIRFETE